MPENKPDLGVYDVLNILSQHQSLLCGTSPGQLKIICMNADCNFISLVFGDGS